MTGWDYYFLITIVKSLKFIYLLTALKENPVKAAEIQT